MTPCKLLCPPEATSARTIHRVGISASLHLVVGVIWTSLNLAISCSGFKWLPSPCTLMLVCLCNPHVRVLSRGRSWGGGGGGGVGVGVKSVRTPPPFFEKILFICNTNFSRVAKWLDPHPLFEENSVGPPPPPPFKISGSACPC